MLECLWPLRPCHKEGQTKLKWVGERELKYIRVFGPLLYISQDKRLCIGGLNMIKGNGLKASLCKSAT